MIGGHLGKKKKKANAEALSAQRHAEMNKADSHDWLSHKEDRASHRGHGGKSTQSTEELCHSRKGAAMKESRKIRREREAAARRRESSGSGL
jgi:hypothetical protein